MRQRTFYMLIGIIIVAVIAIVVDISGNGPYTLNILHPGGIKVSEGLDLQGGARVLLKALPTEPGQKIDSGTMDTTRTIIEKRVNGGLGVSEPSIQTVTDSKGNNYLSVELAGVKDLQKAESLLQQTGQLTLVANKTTDLQPGQSTKGYQVLARGTDISADTVQAGTDQTTGKAVVDFTVNSAAANRIATYTAQYAGTGFMAIALDGKVYSDPQVQQAIPNGQIQITIGSGGIPAANDLATVLRYGALPVKLQINGVQAVSATLGPSNVRASLIAGAVGLFIVMLFMALYYRLPGLLADAALIIYALVVFAIFKLIPVTLTLAGIAGFILSIGMAVDANILIFERMKEELRGGLSVAAAVNAGFARAWPSIRDSNISTMITCAILWYFGSRLGTSVIVGFAVTLLIGVIVSMLTAVLVSRTFLQVVLAGSRVAAHRATLFGGDVRPSTTTSQGATIR